MLFQKDTPELRAATQKGARSGFTLSLRLIAFVVITGVLLSFGVPKYAAMGIAVAVAFFPRLLWKGIEELIPLLIRLIEQVFTLIGRVIELLETYFQRMQEENQHRLP